MVLLPCYYANRAMVQQQCCMVVQPNLLLLLLATAASVGCSAYSCMSATLLLGLCTGRESVCRVWVLLLLACLRAG